MKHGVTNHIKVKGKEGKAVPMPKHHVMKRMG
jgi:hypothetical protein